MSNKKKTIIGIISFAIVFAVILSSIYLTKGISTSNETNTGVENNNNKTTEPFEDIVWEEDSTNADESTSNTESTAQTTNSDNPYIIKINRLLNCVTIYSKDTTGDYTVPVKSMVCSTGRDTPVGTFKTSDKYTWRKLVGNVWGQYAYRITGQILFHSVPYFSQNNADLETLEFNKLGTAASLGCIRLQVIDAKWLIENCPKGTKVIIYDDDSSPGPLGKPNALLIPETITWDPTDPDSNNPWITNIMISGLKDFTVEAGNSNYNLLENVKATDGAGTDITNSLTINGTINHNLIGNYNLVYTCTDAFGHSKSMEIIVNVKDSTAPTINILNNYISVNPNNIANIESLLINNVSVSDFSLNSISVSPVSVNNFSDFVSGNEYQVEYTAIDNANNKSTKRAFVKYSSPIITWNKSDDKIEYKANEYLESCVTVTYNSGLTKKSFDVIVEDLAGGKYKLTYKATDSFNNTFVFVKEVMLIE